MCHRNAPLTPTGRLRLARCVVEDGWPLRRAAERFQVAVTTAKRWADRYRGSGEAGMVDRSSRPRRSPRHTSTRVERRVIGVRATRRWGPARIAGLLRLNPSTVHRVLAQYGMPRLAHLDRAMGQPVRRYERDRPGELIHVDIKKLGNIPTGGGHRFTDRQTGKRHRTQTPGKTLDAGGNSHVGYAYIHTAVDDHCRLAYSEILTDERKETACGFWSRAQAWFAACGITVERVLTDNGACYKTFMWQDLLRDNGITHKRTRPYRPHTNGKVERLNRTMTDEWAHARPYQSEQARHDAFAGWLHHYNHHRFHAAINGTPANRAPNLSKQNT